MMRTIRSLATEKDWQDYAAITMNAYPGMRASGESGRQRIRDRALQMQADPIIDILGLFEANEMRGIMRFYDFTMKLHSTRTLVGGLGGVAVDLLHKKEKVAHDMVQYFLRRYKEKDACMTALYPFRPDFYRQMGFGYGRKLNQYRFHPRHLPQNGAREKVAFLTSRDKTALNDCYLRLLQKTNGLIENSEFMLAQLFDSERLKLVGYWHEDRLQGYLAFQFEPVQDGNFLRNNLNVRFLVTETPEALLGLLAFLRTQADQIETIILNTHDDDFHLLLHDPRNGSQNLLPSVYHESNVQGVGIMYRVIDVPRLFAVLRQHNFGGQTCRLKLTLSDGFFPENAGSWVIDFVDGRPQLAAPEAYDVELMVDVAEFSSLAVGAVTLKQLLAYGLAELSDAVYVETVHRLFFTEQKPLCLTSF